MSAVDCNNPFFGLLQVLSGKCNLEQSTTFCTFAKRTFTNIILTNKVSTECPHLSTTVRYSTAVGSQWSLDITLTIESDNLMEPCIIEPIIRYSLLPDNTCPIRKQPLSSTHT